MSQDTDNQIQNMQINFDREDFAGTGVTGSPLKAWAPGTSSGPRVLTDAQVLRLEITPAWFFLLLTKLPLREKLAVALSGWLGPRISEAFGFKWQDLDLDDGVVTFRRGFVQGRITLLKTEASRTNLPLPEEVLDLLRQWRSITPYPTKDDWVFASPYTKGQRPFWPAPLLKTHIKPVALKAGLPSIGCTVSATV